MYNAQVQAEATIGVPAQQVFDFLVSPDKIPLVMPSLIENYNIPPLPLEQGSEFSYKYQLYGVVLEGSWIVTAIEPPTRYEARTTGAAESEWRYRLTERNGSTHIVLTVQYETPQSVLQQVKSSIVEAMNQREAETYIQNLKMVLEMQGG